MLRRIRPLLGLLVGFTWFAVLTATAQSGRTFYIDYASGSNANSGTSGSAPWKTHPYMNHSGACDGGAGPSYAHQSGDKFVFKGGSDWPASCFQITLSVGGTSSAQDYYGVCLSTDPDSPCYGGTSWPSTGWTRPFWGGSNSYIGSGNHFVYANGANDFSAPSFGYITIDNIEIGNWNAAPGGAGSPNVFSGPAIALGGSQQYLAMAGGLVENMYIHDWVSDTPMVASNPPAVLAYGVVYGAAVMTNTTISDQNGHYYVTSGGTNQLINMPTMGGCAGCGEVKNSVIKYGWMGCSSCYSVHDNDFSEIMEDGTYTYPNPPQGLSIHSHIIYDDGGLQQTFYVYNNAIHDSPNAGLNVYVAYTSYIFNNVTWNLGNNAAFDLVNCIAIGNPCSDNSSKVGYFANNTTDMSAGWYCYRWDPNSSGTGLGTLNFYNNICIPSGSGAGSFSVATVNGSSTNHTMSTSEASTYGFTAGNKYSPTSSDPNTAAKGANLTQSCNSVSAALCLDSSGTPWFGGTSQARPGGSTVWELGAYVSGGTATASKPSAPTSLTASVN
jgi:hypothetical protein